METTLSLPIGNNSASPRNSPSKSRTRGSRVTHTGVQANPITPVVPPTTPGAPSPCRGGTWMHPEDRKNTGMSVRFLTKGLTWNSASQNVSGGLRKSKIDPIMYNSPSTLPASNYFQLRGFPESNVVCLFILLLPPNVFLLQVLIHSREIDFKRIQVSVPSTSRLGKYYCSEKQGGTVHISGNFCSNVSLQHPG